MTSVRTQAPRSSMSSITLLALALVAPAVYVAALRLLLGATPME